ncbi:hypothetical protein BDF14DRAFT_1808596 [Spinellus fusiger]|nr:hypothetical protein BDF14DRAFT_1808596 [Spinellus fusiger]
MQQTVAAIIELSVHKLSTIVNSLASALDTVSKAAPAFHSISDALPSVEVMQSQLFLLRLLSACMRHYWTCFRQLKLKDTAHTSSSSSFATTSTTNTTTPITTNATTTNATTTNATTATTTTTTTSHSYLHSSTTTPTVLTLENDFPIHPLKQVPSPSPRTTPLHPNKSSNARSPLCLTDPPPLDEALVTFLMVLLSRFIYQAHVLEETNELYDNASIDSVGPDMTVFAPRIDFATYELVMSIQAAAGKVLHYVSASNWSSYYAKIKNAVHALSVISDTTETSITELRFLECCCLTRERLSIVLTELSPYFLNIENDTKLLFAKLMRTAIWRWIESYPAEFAELYESEERLMTGPEVLFDLCNSNVDSPRKKSILWPLRSILLALSPDVLTQAYLDTTSSQNRRTVFLKMLGKTLRTVRSNEIAALCFVDLCKAATYVSPTEDNVLRHIAIDVEDDLRESVWNVARFSVPQTSVASGGYKIDQLAFASDHLLSQLRMDNIKALETIVSICLEENAPFVFKMAFVKSCSTIVNQPSNACYVIRKPEIRALLCDRLRSLFLVACTFEQSSSNRSDTSLSQFSMKKLQGDRMPRKDSQTRLKENRMLLDDILRLYRADPLLALKDNVEGCLESNTTIVVSVLNLLQHSESTIRQLSSECIVKLYDQRCIYVWGPRGSMTFNFWHITLQTHFLLSKQILENPRDDNIILFVLSLFAKLSAAKSIFLRNSSCYMDFAQMTKSQLQAAIALEFALLISLCSTKSEACSVSARCIGYLCAESVYFTVSSEEKNKDYKFLLTNADVYKAMTREDSIFVGRKAQQKCFRKHFRMFSTPTPGILAAWEEAWKRWKALTGPLSSVSTESQTGDDASDALSKKSQSIGQGRDKHKHMPFKVLPAYPNRPESKEEMRVEWENYAGFLASVGGCCLMDSPFVESSSKKGSHLGHAQDTRRIHTPTESETMVDQFLAEMVDLLGSDIATIRESVREILGCDLSTGLYAILFKHLEKRIGTFFNSDDRAVCDPSRTTFVDLVVVILKAILDRLEDPADFLLSVNFSHLIRSCTAYLDQHPTTPIVLRAKVKLCHLVDALVMKKEQIVVRDEMRLRNRLLDTIVEWTSGFTSPMDIMKASTGIQEPIQIQRLRRDLDQACLKTISVLLRQLPLQACEPTTETDAAQVKSRLFYKYLAFFLKLLNRCRLNEIDSTTSSIKSEEAAHDWTSLKENTILSMSNLLSANIETGLKYSLAMGYHEETRTRTAFMQVLANVLKEGARFDTLDDNLMLDRYEQLIDLLTESDISAILSLCNICPPSDTTGLIETIIQCFESREKTMLLLKEVITKEVASTEQEATLFRSTTIATQFLSIFAQSHCGNYIQCTLQSVMDEIYMLPEHMQTWELDSQKLKPGEDIITNKENVIRVTKLLLNVICSSSNSAPRVFREELALIADTVQQRFPEAKYSAVGGFVILRLFGPAIVAPENSMLPKLTSSGNSNVRKLLLQATRIIQNLANNVLFGAKETHMIVLNDFLTSNIYLVTSFLRQISTVPPLDAASIDSRVMPFDQKIYGRIHRYVSDNFERMARDLSERMTKEDHDDTQRLLEYKRTLDKFSNLLAQLGRPPDISQVKLTEMTLSYSTTSNNHYFFEFINRNRDRDITAISTLNIVYQAGVSRSGRPVFYLLLRKTKGEDFDFELLTYYVLLVLEPHFKKPFELLFDITCFNADCRMPPHWLNQFLQLLFSEVRNTLCALYLFNPNTHIQRYMAKLSRALVAKFTKQTMYILSIQELQEYIAPSEIRLPKQTVDIDKEKCVVFTPVTKVTNMVPVIPVTIKIGQEYLQIITVRKQELLWDMNTFLNDVYHISEIESMFSIGTPRNTENGGEFCLKADHGQTSLTFTSAKTNAILSLLRFNKTRYDELSRTSNIHENIIHPSDVPGRLLNMVLINLGASDPDLRVSAYSLLCSLSSSFRFDVGNQLNYTPDICIPANCTHFIVNISKTLAESESQLTLQFLAECFTGLAKSDKQTQLLCIDYMSPWLCNLALFTRVETEQHNNRSVSCARDILKLLIDITVTHPSLYKHIQAKVWKLLAEVDELVDIILDSFIQHSVESGVGSSRAEMLADTFVTMAGTSVRGKVISRMRRIIQQTSVHSCRDLSEHPSWTEIAVLLRFLLMLSFNSVDITRTYLPETFHIASLLAATGPVFIRSSVYELVINLIHSLCTSAQLADEEEKKLQFLLNEMCDTKTRFNFGLSKTYGQAYAVTSEFSTDSSMPLSLLSLENIVRLLLDALSIGATSSDVSNMWRARWMGLVASTTFQFNPAIQPRSFIVLGCLAQDEIDDDFVYQILIALKGALNIFEDNDASLIVSIMMCLKNIIHHMPAKSRYIKSLFWVAVSLVQMNHPVTLPIAIQFLQSVIQALDANNFFLHDKLSDVLMESRIPIRDIAREIDRESGVNFDTHFSFAVAGILLKGLVKNDPKSSVLQCLAAFLEIDRKRSIEENIVKSHTIGYFAILLPFAIENGALRELLRVAGVDDIELDGIEFGSSYVQIFDKFEIPDNTTGLLLVSLLANMVNTSDSEVERQFLYELLAEAASSLPEVFSLVYESLLPKMNQVVVSSQNFAIIDTIKGILMTACTEPVFNNSTNDYCGQKQLLEELGFPSLADTNFTPNKPNTLSTAMLISNLISIVTE